MGEGYYCLTSDVFPTKLQPELREETFQPESGKIAVEGTFYVLSKVGTREGEKGRSAATIFEKCPPQHTVNLKRAAVWNRRDDIHSVQSLPDVNTFS